MRNTDKTTLLDSLKEVMAHGLSREDAVKICRVLIAFMIVISIVSVALFVRNIALR